jgi:hypothetical protein
MIIEFFPEKVGHSQLSSHFISGKNNDNLWRIELRRGLNKLSDVDVDNFKSSPDFDNYLKRGAILLRENPETPFQRTLELEGLYKSQGYSAIATLAIKFGIPKPTSGWKDAIPLIVQAESEVT